jgi:hypothetical protein
MSLRSGRCAFSHFALSYYFQASEQPDLLKRFYIAALTLDCGRRIKRFTSSSGADELPDADQRNSNPVRPVIQLVPQFVKRFVQYER